MNSNEWLSLSVMLVGVYLMMCGYGFLMPSLKERYDEQKLRSLKNAGACAFFLALLNFLLARSG